MRPTPWTLATQLAPSGYRWEDRVEITDADGAWRDVSAWYQTWKWSEGQDQAAASGTLTFRREAMVSGVLQSLAPLVAASPLNRNSANAYAPLVNPFRRFRKWCARIAWNATRPAANSALWFLEAQGTVDDPSWGGLGDSVLTLPVRDSAAPLMDTPVTVARTYGSEAGTPIATVMNAILSDNGRTETVRVLGDTQGWSLQPYVLAVGTTEWDALRTLATQMGWDFRFWWASDGTYAPTLRNPPRDTSTVSVSFTAAQFTDLPDLSLVGTDVRNDGTLAYTDSTTGVASTAHAENAGSITAYGRRPFGLPAQLNIDTLSEAQQLIDAAVADLAAPALNQRATHPYLPGLQLGDVLEYPATIGTGSNPLYDTAQRFGVTAFEHTIAADGTRSTTVTLRGRPVGAYSRWLELAAQRSAPKDGTNGTAGPPGAPALAVVPFSDSFSAGYLTRDGNTFVRSDAGGEGWNYVGFRTADAFSAGAAAGGGFGAPGVAFGVTRDGALGSIERIDFAWARVPDSTQYVAAYASGALIYSTVRAWDPAERYAVQVVADPLGGDGVVHYLVNGEPVESRPAPAGAYYGRAAWGNHGGTLRDFGFAPGAPAGVAGTNGVDGANGSNGLPGAPGANGVTLYTWIAYADAADGSANFTTGAAGGRAYIGLANNQTTATEGTDYHAYTWSPWRGANGTNGTDGIPGTPGADGQPTYTWFAYADSADGTVNFTTGVGGDRAYIGVSPNHLSATEGTDPSAYGWTKIQGPQGVPGAAGGSPYGSAALAFANGDDGFTLTFASKYAGSSSTAAFMSGQPGYTTTNLGSIDSPYDLGISGLTLYTAPGTGRTPHTARVTLRNFDPSGGPLGVQELTAAYYSASGGGA